MPKKSLDWSLLDFPTHRGVQSLLTDLNKLYTTQPALHQVDFDWNGFRWINASDYEKSVISFIRYSEDTDDYLVFVFNFTPQVYNNYVIGVPEKCAFNVIFNSDSHFYGGSNVDVPNPESHEGEWHGLPAHMSVVVPPLAGVIYKPVK
jgi:1,4-alpha-glucan branching enzyme